MAHAFAFSFASFAAARFALGFGEAGVFRQALSAWRNGSQKKERALATGIFNAGTNIGAIVTPLVVPWIAVHLGWRWAFLLTGALGFAGSLRGCGCTENPKIIRTAPAVRENTYRVIPSSTPAK